MNRTTLMVRNTDNHKFPCRICAKSVYDKNRKTFVTFVNFWFILTATNLGVLQNHRPPTGNRSPTTDPPTGAPPTHRQPTNDPSTSVPPTHRPTTTDHRLTDRSSTDPPVTDSSTLIQMTNNPLSRKSYFNRVTIGPILSITNFNSFWMGTIYYWIDKTIYKLIDKKECW